MKLQTKHQFIKLCQWVKINKEDAILSLALVIISLGYNIIILDYRGQIQAYQETHRSYVAANKAWKEFAEKEFCRRKVSDELKPFCNKPDNRGSTAD